MKLLAFTKYSYEGPSSRYRFYNYKDTFAKYGMEMTIAPLFDKNYLYAEGQWSKGVAALKAYAKRCFHVLHLLLFPKAYDLLLVEYELLPYFPAWFEYLLVKRGVKYLVDYDDAIFHKYDRHASTVVRGLLGNKIARVMKYAKGAIVCNAYLESYASQYQKKVVRLPTVVPLKKYDKARKKYKKKSEDPFVIGWIGSRTTSVYVLELLPVMKRFAAKHKDVRFHLVGFDEQLLSKEEQKNCNIDVVAWSEAEEIERILAFDVGIMPLPDDAWSRGKCGFKLIQYMACAKPVVASPVGINCEIVQNGVNGFLAKTEDEWIESLNLFYNDRKICKNIGIKNLEKMIQEYHYVLNSKKYIMQINKVVKQ